MGFGGLGVEGFGALGSGFGSCRVPGRRGYTPIMENQLENEMGTVIYIYTYRCIYIYRGLYKDYIGFVVRVRNIEAWSYRLLALGF